MRCWLRHYLLSVRVGPPELERCACHRSGLARFRGRRSARSGRRSSETGKGLRPALGRRPPLVFPAKAPTVQFKERGSERSPLRRAGPGDPEGPFHCSLAYPVGLLPTPGGATHSSTCFRALGCKRKPTSSNRLRRASGGMFGCACQWRVLRTTSGVRASTSDSDARQESTHWATAAAWL